MRNLKTIIAPSILSADFANLESECRQILIDGADSLHIDIMDGWEICYFRHFVNNLTIGPPVVKALRKKIEKAHFDCHLMVTHPQNYIK
jgi:ribulose-phosphate 3-epimerase